MENKYLRVNIFNESYNMTRVFPLRVRVGASYEEFEKQLATIGEKILGTNEVDALTYYADFTDLILKQAYDAVEKLKSFKVTTEVFSAQTSVFIESSKIMKCIIKEVEDEQIPFVITEAMRELSWGILSHVMNRLEKEGVTSNA